MDDRFIFLEILGPWASRDAAERLASALCDRGIPARVYDKTCGPALSGMFQAAGIDDLIWKAALRDALADKNDAQ